jgi:hypothetical protein
VVALEQFNGSFFVVAETAGEQTMNRSRFTKHEKAMMVLVFVAVTLAAFAVAALLHFVPVAANAYGLESSGSGICRVLAAAPVPLNVEAKIVRCWIEEAIWSMVILFG